MSYWIAMVKFNLLFVGEMHRKRLAVVRLQYTLMTVRLDVTGT